MPTGDVAASSLFLVGCVLFTIDGIIYVSECSALAEVSRETRGGGRRPAGGGRGEVGWGVVGWGGAIVC